MRELTKKQKDILKILFKKGISNAEQIPLIYWEELKKINDTEILYQNVNRFLGDLDLWEVTQTSPKF